MQQLPQQWQKPDGGNPRRRGSSLWARIVLAALAAAVSGLIVAGETGHTDLTWLLGVGLMAALPLLGLAALIVAVASHFHRGKDGA